LGDDAGAKRNGPSSGGRSWGHLGGNVVGRRPATFGYQEIISGSPPLLNFAQEDDWLNCLSIVESEQYCTAALMRTR